MKKTVFAILVGLLLLVPVAVLANGPPGGPGCWFLGTDLNGIAGFALVGVSVGIVLFSRRP